MTEKKATKAKKTAKKTAKADDFVPETTSLPDFPGVSSRALAGLAAKVKKAKDSYKKSDAINDLVEWNERAAFWWSLLRHGVVPFWSEPLLWSDLAELRARDEEAAPPRDVALLLSKIQSYKAGGGYKLTLALPSWPKPLDDLVLPAYLEDPSAFAGYEAWPELVRRGFETVLVRAGALPRERLGEGFVRELARLHLEDYGLTERQNLVMNGERWVYDEMYDRQQHPADDFWSFVETFTPKDAFLAALDEEASTPEFLEEHRSSLMCQQIDVLRRAPIPRLAQHLDKCGLDSDSVSRLHALLLERSDAPADLYELARLLVAEGSNQLKGEVALVRGVLRAAERREPIPEDIDELFQLRGVQVGYKPIDPVQGVAETCRALAALGRDRARRVIERAITAEYGFSEAFPVLHAFVEERDLIERAFARLASWRYGSREIFMGIALFPPASLPLLAEQHDAVLATGGPQRAELVRRGIQGVLAKAAQAGSSWDAAFDRFLDVHGYETDIEGKPLHNADYEYSHYVASVLRVAVGGLPPERRRAWLAASLDAEKPGFARVLPALPRDDQALIGEALAFLARHHERARMAYTDWLAEIARDLGDAALPHVRAVLEASKSPRFKKSFDDALGAERVKQALAGSIAAEVREETPIEKIRRLAKGVGGPTTAITILESVDREEDDDEDGEDDGGAELGVSRVGGPGFDLGERQPRYDDAPMTHVFTLATEDVPALRAAFPEAAAVALYVANPDLNEAYTPYNSETAVVALRKEDLGRGLAQPTSKDLGLAEVRATTLDVPAAAFDGEGEAKELRGAIYQLHARAGGEPIWLQDEEGGGRFLLQVDEGFASMNLGDCGVMYVFDDTAYWQCH